MDKLKIITSPSLYFV